jgi:beta-lactamase superfamily II metal-dependent hydrolase
MTITLLSPYENRLRKLRRVWEAEIEKAGLTPGQAGRELETLPAPHEKEDEAILGEALNIDALAHSAFRADSSEANGSSIACMAEFEGRKCIFAGDAFAPDLTASIRKFAATAGTSKLKIDALKLAHHGGRKNTNVDLIQCLACEHFLFSTDGSYYQHPDQETIARILCHGHAGGAISLYFNHRVPETEMWQDRNLQRRFDYRTVYPIPTESGLIVELDA